jgi:hypothetical protein
MTDDLSDANRRMLNHLRDRVEELESDNERLADRVAELEQVVNPDPATAYDEMSRDRKVFRVRKALVEEAATGHGAASMDYKEVRWLFDGQPSPGHAYDLMELAGALDGFEYDNSHDTKRVTVKLASVNDETLIHAANKATAT